MKILCISYGRCIAAPIAGIPHEVVGMMPGHCKICRLVEDMSKWAWWHYSAGWSGISPKMDHMCLLWPMNWNRWGNRVGSVNNLDRLLASLPPVLIISCHAFSWAGQCIT